MNDERLKQLLGEYQRLRTYMDTVPDLICFKDSEYRYVEVNYALADLVGTSPAQMIGRTGAEFLPAAMNEGELGAEQEVLRTGESSTARTVELAFGPSRWYSATTIPWFEPTGELKGTITVMRDITDLQIAKLGQRDRVRMQDILFCILEISLREMPLKEQLAKALDLVLNMPWLPLAPCGGVFLAADGSDDLLLLTHRNLAPALQTQCSRVPFGRCLCGRAAQSQAIVFADTIDERHDIAHEDMSPHGHYCVPLLSGSKLLGVLVLYTESGHPENDTEIKYMKAIADALAGLIERAQASQRAKRAHEIQLVLNDIIRISVQPMGLHEQLHQILDRIFDVPWIALESKGCIHLVSDDAPDMLTMVAQRGLPQPILERCSRLRHGYCLCGRAAATRQIVFRSHVERDHDVQYPKMTDHGHYCLPILSGDRLLGVLNLYVASAHARSTGDETFLSSVANTLAGIIERKRAEEALRYQASYDSLTGLANRALLMQRLEQCVQDARRNNDLFAVLYLDLDRFKPVNDTLGHAAGDQLLVIVAQRLNATVRESDTVARLGGDEFAIILSRIKCVQDAASTARRLIQAVSQPIKIGETSCQVGTSVGIAVFPEHGASSDVLLRAADHALYEVKGAGRGSYRFGTRQLPRSEETPGNLRPERAHRC